MDLNDTLATAYTNGQEALIAAMREICDLYSCPESRATTHAEFLSDLAPIIAALNGIDGVLAIKAKRQQCATCNGTRYERTDGFSGGIQFCRSCGGSGSVYKFEATK